MRQIIQNSTFIFLISVLLSSCLSQTADPQKIIDAAITKHGGETYTSAKISFDFRDRHYTRERNGGKFVFRRAFADSAQNEVVDMLTNENFIREVSGAQVDLSDEDKGKYTASVNSVIYFALLPYRLNDAAVNKKYIGSNSINGESYHKVEVTFNQEGGGEDFEDVFVYWVHKSNATVDYIAYSYAEDHGTGYRFRESYNKREVNGILFQDYINMKSEKTEGLYPGDMDEMYKAGDLKELSRIELENIQVNAKGETEEQMATNE